MGIMDLQAQLVAGALSGRLGLDKEKVQAALDANKLIRTTRPRAQFPRFDYTGEHLEPPPDFAAAFLYTHYVIILLDRIHGYISYALL